MKYTLDTSCQSFGAYAELLPADGGESILYQSDWDLPGLARMLGWRGKIGREKCRHVSTDGTIDCKACGRTASQFISAALDYIDSKNGEEFELDSGE